MKTHEQLFRVLMNSTSSKIKALVIASNKSRAKRALEIFKEMSAIYIIKVSGKDSGPWKVKLKNGSEIEFAVWKHRPRPRIAIYEYKDEESIEAHPT